MKWRIYYGDGTTYDGETQEDAFNAPTKNVQLTKQEADNERGHSIRHGSDFHCWEGFRWGGKDREGLVDYIIHHQGPQKILLGREIHDETYQKICRQAVKDGCFCETKCEHFKEE